MLTSWITTCKFRVFPLVYGKLYLFGFAEFNWFLITGFLCDFNPRLLLLLRSLYEKKKHTKIDTCALSRKLIINSSSNILVLSFISESLTHRDIKWIAIIFG